MKRKLFIDFDNTIVDSTQAICNIYNNTFSKHPNFVPARPENSKDWYFLDVCPLADRDWIEDCFCKEAFFEDLRVFYGFSIAFKILADFYDIYIVTIGEIKNLELKARYISDRLPFIKNTILLSDNNNFVGKSIVDMNNGILVDDTPYNLSSSNASLKLLFNKYKYFTDTKDKFLSFCNWESVIPLLKTISYL